MPEYEELIDAISNALEGIETDLNEGKKEGEHDLNVAIIDQKWAMLRVMLVGKREEETV